MIENKVLELINNCQEDRCFTICHNLGRGLLPNNLRPEGPHITKSKIIKIWKIDGEILHEKEENFSVLFDNENYLIQWEYRYVLSDESQEFTETILFQWKGTSAEKVAAPLPSLMEGQDPIVERAYQWSEPPIFFQIFSKQLIVIGGKEKEFDSSSSRLFITRGELLNEIHLFEIPCKIRNLRSRAIFFLIVPNKSTIFCWSGTAVPLEYQHLIINQLNLSHTLKSIHKHWRDFKNITLEKDDILTEIEDTSDIYYKIQDVISFTPRLFYIYFMDENLFGVEVEYSLRSAKNITPFPFLQTHLYTATQPALFLLDNHNEIWLWKGIIDEETDMVKFAKELELTEELVVKYAEKRRSATGLAITIKYSSAREEPVEFTNIFPLWDTL